MSKTSISIYLRVYVNNNLLKLLNKAKCDLCGSTENLQIHHSKNYYFDDIIKDAMSILNLKYYSYASDYSRIELDILSNYVLGKHVSAIYSILCPSCHTKYHSKNGYRSPNYYQRKYSKQIEMYEKEYGETNIQDIIKNFNKFYFNYLCKKYKNVKMYEKERMIFKKEIKDFVIHESMIGCYRKYGTNIINDNFKFNDLPFRIYSIRDRHKEHRGEYFYIIKDYL
jgi:hypothetical protein